MDFSVGAKQRYTRVLHFHYTTITTALFSGVRLYYIVGYRSIPIAIDDTNIPNDENEKKTIVGFKVIPYEHNILKQYAEIFYN